jgi:hypothetical protein
MAQEAPLVAYPAAAKLLDGKSEIDIKGEGA